MLHYTTPYCKTLTPGQSDLSCWRDTASHCNTPNTLQHAATRCNTLQHTATRCKTRQHAATRCNTLQHTWLWHSVRAPLPADETLQHVATHYNTRQHHCNTTAGLQNSTLTAIATQCNTLQHAAVTLHHHSGAAGQRVCWKSQHTETNCNNTATPQRGCRAAHSLRQHQQAPTCPPAPRTRTILCTGKHVTSDQWLQKKTRDWYPCEHWFKRIGYR